MAQTKAQLLGPVVGDVTIDASTLSLDAENNKVGIGTTEADLRLHVNGPNALPSSSGSTSTGHLTLRDKANNASHGMFMGVSDASPWSSWIQAQDANNNATNYPLLLNPNGGNVGIGTDNPAYELSIHGTDAVRNEIVCTNNNAAGAGIYLRTMNGGSTVSNATLHTNTSGDLLIWTGTSGASERLRITSAGNIRVPDDGKFTAGAGDDLQIYHDGSHNRIKSLTGGLYLHVANGEFLSQDGSEVIAKFLQNAAVELYYDNVKKLETDTNGIRIGSGGGDNTIIDLHNASYDNGVIQYYNGSIALKTGSSSGDRTFQVHTAGSEKLRITSDGKVGIDQVSPQSKVQIDLADSVNYQNGDCFTLSSGDGSSANLVDKLNFGISSTNNYAWIQSMKPGTGSRNLVLQPSGGNVGINQNSPNKAKLHVVGPGTGSDEIIAKFKGGSGGDCISKIGIVAGYSDTANDTEGHVYIGALRQGNGNQSSMIFQTDGQNTRMRIAADGSTYRGGTVITESDMNWGHDTYQRPHIFSGQVGGNPSDGAIVLASPETNPSNARIGALLYGCKTSSASGVANSGLKAAIEGITNTNVSDAWKTGGNLRFLVRPDNGNLSEVLKINSFGDIYTRSIYSGNYGGGLFIGNNADPTGNLCALRDGNKRPVIYLGGSYPEINLVHDVVSNTSHGPTIRFASYVQSTNTPTGSQFVIGTNGVSNRLDIGYAAAAQNANIHNGIDSYNGTTALRIYNTGSVVTPAQPGFYARRSVGGDGRAVAAQEWIINGTSSYNTGSHFNTSNGRFTAPVAGKYIFMAQPGYKQTGQNLNVYFRINNSSQAEPIRFIDGGDDLVSHSAVTGSVIFNLAVNDYVDLYMGNIHHVNTTFNFFTGYLLG